MTTLPFEYSEEAPGRPIIIDREEAYRITALLSAFPPTVESFEE